MKLLKGYSDFILETSKYKDINDERFISLFNRIVAFHGETNKRYINDFKNKLYTFLSSDEHKMFKVNFFDAKRKRKKLISVIHELDSYNAKIMIRRGKIEATNISNSDLKPVWQDKEKEIYVYLANNVFESIKLGRGTNFCISSSLDDEDNENYFYNYMYSDDRPSRQVSSIYFIKSPNNKIEWTTIALDVRDESNERNGSKFLYTDVRNQDVEFKTFEDLISGKNGIKRFDDDEDEDEDNDVIIDYDEEDEYEVDNDVIIDYDVSDDLKYIPSEVFKFVKHTITLEELLVNIKLIQYAKYDNIVTILADPRLEKEDLIKILSKESFYMRNVSQEKINILKIMFKKLFSYAGDNLYEYKNIFKKYFENCDMVFHNKEMLQKFLPNNNLPYHIMLSEYYNLQNNKTGESFVNMNIFIKNKMNQNLNAVMHLVISYCINEKFDGSINFSLNITDKYMKQAIDQRIKGNIKFEKELIMKKLNNYINGTEWFYGFTRDLIETEDLTQKQREKLVNEYVLPMF